MAYWVTLGQFIRYGVEYTQNIRPGILHISPELLRAWQPSTSVVLLNKSTVPSLLTQYICGSSHTPPIVSAGNVYLPCQVWLSWPSA